mmetsp:Transcript_19689/g.24315  ORF Transcript_19689/g.24315 Transcript_19689/m.24315 type:complete len:92 (-) Transcript_19689:66-341(-)
MAPKTEAMLPDPWTVLSKTLVALDEWIMTWRQYFGTFNVVSYNVEESVNRTGEEIEALTGIFEGFIFKTQTTDTTRSISVVPLPCDDTEFA